MNEQQRLYLIQARSDWRIFLLLNVEPVCHRLHYLQMCTEKLAKAYFWAKPGAQFIGHAAFVKFLLSIAYNRKIAAHFHFTKVSHFAACMNEVSDLAYEFERLAPALAGDGPNPEYPWPRSHPEHVPVEEDFEVWTRLQGRQGNNLYRLLEQVLNHFESWF